MRDCLMMRDMARAYEGLIMNNIEKARATGDQNKIKEADEAVDRDLTGGNCLEFNKQDHKIVADFKPFGVTDET